MNYKNMVYDVKEAKNFREMIENSAADYPQNNAFVIKRKDSTLREITYTEYFDDIKNLSAYFNSIGLEYKKIAIVGKNCYEWALTYLAVACGTGVIIPIDKELKSHDIQNILEMSEASAIIYTPSMESSIGELSSDILKISTEEISSLLEIGKSYQAENSCYEKHIVNSYEMGVLLYTSGTTGVAKGVMLSQNNICFNIFAVKRHVLVTPEDRVMSVLPLHHTYECTAGFLTMIYSGASITYLESLRKVADDFKLYAPTIFITVPLLLENIHMNIMKKFKSVKGGMAAYSFGTGLSKAADIINVDLRSKLFKQIHEFFGGKLKKMLIGAAALSPKIFDDFRSFGFDMYNGYGLTETSPVCLMHDDFMQREADTIGKPILDTEAKIFEPNEKGIGEIIFNGKNTMLGYYKNQEETDKVIVDGWFHTGDMAYIDKNGYYRLQGRKKTMIVTPNGKKIFPEEMEFLLAKKAIIKEVMVIGNETANDVIVCAKIFPDYEIANAALLKQGILPESTNYDEELKALILKEVKDVNRSVPNYKAVKSIEIRKTEFDKTTTKKIKRYTPNNIQ